MIMKINHASLGLEDKDGITKEEKGHHLKEKKILFFKLCLTAYVITPLKSSLEIY